MSNLPFVSVLTPTYERRKFLPLLLDFYNRQTYPVDKRELIILDDSETSNQDLIDEFLIKYPENKIKYHYVNQKMKLGKKRNTLNSLATGEYIIYFDDDDYYCDDKIKYTITRMLGQKSKFSGSSEMYVYFTDTKLIYRFNRIAPYHCTAGTFCFHRDHLSNHQFQDDADKAEEKYFLDDYKTPMIQIDPFKTILCIAHKKNTFDKRNLISRLVKTNLKLKNFVKEKHVQDFYLNLDP